MVEVGAPGALRVVAWACLLNVYGVLRADDLQRLRPDRAQLLEVGFVAKTERTKTAGVGK